ncbi:hypothetical protein K438DRAFT_1770433 [Mycena galopus ATCC 62051]|nr:hypothetical protein K438DRAFT_1781941 [Mycena galopus ATCC 62051]KAF8176626.1 hypothetical protein K438DRAFT_1770433 [Mycena galopus ATCC 62051]
MLLKVAFFALIPAILAVDHPVTVGANNGLTFTPTSVQAYPGDTVTFTFVSKNHTSTTTTFSGAVCPPPVGGVGPNGWDSGLSVNCSPVGSQVDSTPYSLPVVGTDTPQFVYTVVDRAPHFAACMQAAGAHCRAGMTFALNPTAEMTFAEFNANAMAS